MAPPAFGLETTRMDKVLSRRKKGHETYYASTFVIVDPSMWFRQRHPLFRMIEFGKGGVTFVSVTGKRVKIPVDYGFVRTGRLGS